MHEKETIVNRCGLIRTKFRHMKKRSKSPKFYNQLWDLEAMLQSLSWWRRVKQTFRKNNTVFIFIESKNIDWVLENSSSQATREFIKCEERGNGNTKSAKSFLLPVLCGFWSFTLMEIWKSTDIFAFI